MDSWSSVPLGNSGKQCRGHFSYIPYLLLAEWFRRRMNSLALWQALGACGTAFSTAFSIWNPIWRGRRKKWQQLERLLESACPGQCVSSQKCGMGMAPAKEIVTQLRLTLPNQTEYKILLRWQEGKLLHWSLSLFWVLACPQIVPVGYPCPCWSYDAGGGGRLTPICPQEYLRNICNSTRGTSVWAKHAGVVHRGLGEGVGLTGAG
jgi:hypothetical protein